MTNKKEKVVVVGGCGHIGLPFGLFMADKGKDVVLFDISSSSINKVNAGIMPFAEDNANELLVKLRQEQSIWATNRDYCIYDADVIVICLGTPCGLRPEVDDSNFKETIRNISKHIVNDQLVIMRSTVAPGTTRRFVREVFSDGVEVAFCPERILQGKSLQELANMPQLVGLQEIDDKSRAIKFFKSLGIKTIPLLMEEAELAKLCTNAWRYVTFAFANEVYQLGEAIDRPIDYFRMYDAMLDSYPRMEAFPKPGLAAGPCLLKDSFRLESVSGGKAKMLATAISINEGLPNFIVEYVKKTYGYDKDLRIGILGMTFKADCDDTRDSLVPKLQTLFSYAYDTVKFSDPSYLVNDDCMTPEQLIKESDIIVIGTPHSCYKNLDFRGKSVVDIWGMTK